VVLSHFIVFGAILSLFLIVIWMSPKFLSRGTVLSFLLVFAVGFVWFYRSDLAAIYRSLMAYSPIIKIVISMAAGIWYEWIVSPFGEQGILAFNFP